MKNGFTLVELSIVLVIIGLLIGGILVGQSLIESAKIQSAVRQIQQYDIAVRTFQSKYGSLPGDGVLSGVGNNDGILDSAGTGTDFGAFWQSPFPIFSEATIFLTMDGERAFFWRDLSTSGLNIDGMPNPNTDFSSGAIAGQHIPEFAFDNSVIYATKGRINDSLGNNVYVIVGFESSTDQFFRFGSGSATITEANSLDRKIDNGFPDSGNLGSATIDHTNNFKTGSSPSAPCDLELLNDPNYDQNPRACVIISSINQL